MNTFDTFAQFSKMLRNLDLCLEKASAHATAKKFEADLLLQMRLAPDQYPLVRQLQVVCDTAKFAAAQLSGKTAPSHPDTETTMAQIRERIRVTLTHLETYQAADFAAAEERKCAPAYFQGKWIRGDHYLNQVACPNFYFHATTAYSILRHNGVDVGKLDFMGALPLRDA